MSTTMDPEAQSHTGKLKTGDVILSCLIGCLFCAVIIFVGLYFGGVITFPDPPFTDLTVVVESTAVKAYNLTVDNRLSWAVDLTIRAHNNRTFSPIDMYGYKVEVSKGNSELGLQKKSLNFSLCPGCQELIHVEAVSDGHAKLGHKLARELRADVAAGEGRFDVFIYRSPLCERGYVYGEDCYPPPSVDVTCKNVVLGFARLGERRVQKVDCQGQVIY